MKLVNCCPVFANLLYEIISIRTSHEYRNQALVIHLILVPPVSLPRDNKVINQVRFCCFPGSSYSKNVWWNTWNGHFKVLLSTFSPQTTQRMTLGCSTFKATKSGEWSGREGLRGSGWMSPVNAVKFTTEDTLIHMTADLSVPTLGF